MKRPIQLVRIAATVAVVLVGGSLAPAVTPSAAQTTPACQPRDAGGPVWVTAECVDPPYDRPVIDREEDLTTPVPHRRVEGHFAGTDRRFVFAFPPRGQWNGRFFQLVYPLQDENPAEEAIAFGAASGAYAVQTNGGGGYRVDAAAAKFSETVAAEYYGSSRRIYGYVYGASGGSYQTIAAAENSTGVWDGAVPMVMGATTSITNNFMVRAMARLVLRDAAPQIADAVAPGGSGDPYAGLDEVERAALREATAMGVPLRAWEDPRYVLGLDDPQGLLGIASVVRALDPSYVQDFWNAPGYLGTERSRLGDLVRAALVDHTATIRRVDRNADGVPTSLVLDGAPTDLATTGLDYTARDADGTVLGPLSGSLDPATGVFTLASGNPGDVLDALDAGDRLRVDNRWFIALHAYYRHQVPTEDDLYPFDQFRGPDGEPVYPQRPVEVGPLLSRNVSGGGTHTGDIHAKVIVVQNLLDSDAFPWHADWYRHRVRRALGRDYEDDFRLYFNDNADHDPGPVAGARAARLVPYTGIYQQALRDVAAWAEHGVAPPRSTRYDEVDSQIRVPAGAGQRRGIQPVVDLTANGTDRVEVAAGERVTFTATVQVPPSAGEVVAAEWDLAGSGRFTPAPLGERRRTVRLRTTHTYTTPGTYDPVLRTTAQRDGDAATPFARVQNLDRVRVVVR